MNPSDEHIKKIVGRQQKKNPLKKLKEINAALKKLGCQNSEPGNPGTIYRKIVGRR